MRVTLIASTLFEPITASALTGGRWRPDTGYDADALAEFAGRACYQSWSKPNPATATSKGYMANILDQGHLSVLEHGSATFYVEGVSRALTHELVRHRHLSYSQLSQRFVDESNRAERVSPPAFGESGSQGRLEALADYVDHVTTEAYTEAAHILEREGKSRKQAREAARAFLPNMQETKIVVTGNHRAWREVIERRSDPAADAEIQEFAGHVLHHLKRIAPAIYQDFTTSFNPWDIN